jgi:4-diphosphocytidyl-2-C-methyl-D-erythritol kinase
VAPDRLRTLAVSLGADVPYFLDPKPAQVHGIGEEIEPLAGFPALPVLVATPRPPLATAAVFRAWDEQEPAREVGDLAALTRGNEGRSMLAPSVAGIWWRRLLTNDLEAVAVSLHPGVARLRTEIERAGARAVGMSGSGPTVFGVFGDAEETRAASAGVPWEPTDHVHVGMTTGSR